MQVEDILVCKMSRGRWDLLACAGRLKHMQVSGIAIGHMGHLVHQACSELFELHVLRVDLAPDGAVLCDVVVIFGG